MKTRIIIKISVIILLVSILQLIFTLLLNKATALNGLILLFAFSLNAVVYLTTKNKSI